MPDDFEVRGADEFRRLSKALKDAGRGQVRKEFHRAGVNAAKPVVKKTQQVLSDSLPSRKPKKGPSLASKGANTKQNVAASSTGVRVSVSYKSKAGRGLHGANARLANEKGLVKHPFFGDRERWFTTPVPAAEGWFDDTIRGEAPALRRGLEQVVVNVSARIIREAGL